MLTYHRINIIGCGNLGSCLSFHLVLYSEIDNIKEIHLYDNDCLYESNLPYLTVSLELARRQGYLNSPKVYVLASVLEDIKRSDNLKIVPNNVMFSNDVKLDGYSIDCRDENIDQHLFDLKLAYDGNYGRIIVNPDKISSSKKSRYVYDTCRCKTMRFASDVVEMLFRGKLSDTGDYCLDYNTIEETKCLHPN